MPTGYRSRVFIFVTSGRIIFTFAIINLRRKRVSAYSILTLTIAMSGTSIDTPNHHQIVYLTIPNRMTWPITWSYDLLWHDLNLTCATWWPMWSIFVLGILGRNFFPVRTFWMEGFTMTELSLSRACCLLRWPCSLPSDRAILVLWRNLKSNV